MQHRPALLRIETGQKFRRYRVGEMRSHVCPNLPLDDDTFCAGRARDGTLNLVLIKQRRFFYGYRPAVPVV